MDKKYLAIINASQLITLENEKEDNPLGVIENGALIIEDGLIQWIGTTDQIQSSELYSYLKKDDIIDAGGKLVMPGYVDSHTHFVFGGTREDEYDMRLSGMNYMDIMKNGGGIANSVRATRETDEAELYRLGMERLNGMLAYGVTTVEGKSGYGMEHDTEMKQLRVMKALNENHVIDIKSTFLGAHSVMPQWKDMEYDYLDKLIEKSLPIIKEQGLAEFVDIFCEMNVFNNTQSRYYLQAAKDMGFKLKIHADEIYDLGGGEIAADLGAVSADHLLSVSELSLKRMKEEGVVATLLPATAFSLREHYAPARKMLDQGMTVALATDYNPGSCPTYSIPLVIALATLNMHMTIEEVIRGLTINGAKALNIQEQCGSLAIGKQGDLTIHHIDQYRKIPYNLGMNTVKAVIKGGQLC